VRPALEGVDLAVVPGELVGVVGLTGAGKSTLLRAVAGIVPHLIPASVSGGIHVTGLDPLAGPVGALAGRVGLVLDDPDGQISQATVAEEIALGLESLAVPWPEMMRRVDEVLAVVGLTGMGDRSPATLSGGEQQRLAIACAVAMRPSVFLMDEPAASLDPAGATAVFDLARRLSNDGGHSVLVADHDVERLAAQADRIVVLHEGRVVADGPAAEVLGQPGLLADRGIRVPQVTELAARVAHAWPGPAGARSEPVSTPLPVTVEAALAWLGNRGGGPEEVR
jgi:energy-coupling factor transport system ATP-binding protein